MIYIYIYIYISLELWINLKLGQITLTNTLSIFIQSEIWFTLITVHMAIRIAAYLTVTWAD